MALTPSGMTPTLQTLLTQFRARYPMGSLLSEFHTVHDGLYVVRAIAQIGGTPLSTGLAAEPSIEQAEDRAKIRAIEALGIQSFMSPMSTSAFTSSDLLASSPEVATPITKPLTPTPLDTPVLADTASSLSTPALSETVTTSPPSESSAIPFAEPAPSAPQKRAPVLSKEGHRTVEPVTVEPNFEPELEPASSPPMDLSDVIAQTTVELKRLGWTDAQGRKHLQQTYSKRSRQQLTDDELLDFLQYLQTQP